MRGQTLRAMARVGLVGGSPYHRDLIRAWLADTPQAGTIIPLVNGHRATHRSSDGRGGSGAETDLFVGIIQDADDATLDTCRQLTQPGRSRPFVAVLLTPGRQVLQTTLDAGAAGLVAAVSGPRALADAITAVTSGAAWLDPALSPIVLTMARSQHVDDRHGLTPTEQRVAAHFGDGLTNREIADRLGIGEETVKTHVSNIYRKLDVADRASVVTLLRPHAAHLPAAGS